MSLLYIGFQQHQWIISQKTLWPVLEIFVKKIALDGDWIVAFSEIIFLPTKLNNVTDEEFTYLRVSEVAASISNAGNRNTISRPYCGENFFYQIRRVHFYRTID